MQLTYYIAPWDQDEHADVEQPEVADDVHAIRHGYNLADLNRLARWAIWRVVGSMLDVRTRYEVAWSAIAEALYIAPDDQPPAPDDLVRAGQNAIAGHVREEMHHHGRDRHNGGAPMPRFASYWEGMRLRVGGPEHVVVERTALWQIWPRLTDRQRQVLLALAAHEDYQAAAQALDANPGTFNVNVSHARKRFLELWHEGEEPSRVWGTDRRVGSRTAAEPPSRERRPATRAVARRNGRPTVDLVHGRASTYTNRGCRCEPCTQAATDKARADRRAKGARARRLITDADLAVARERRAAGETLTAIASDLGFANGALSRALRRPIRGRP